MEKTTINAGDWTGEQKEVEFDRAKWRIRMYGTEEFVLDYKSFPEGPSLEELRAFRIKEDGEKEEYATVTARRWNDEGLWEATDGYVEREKEDPYVAIAQVLFNIL